MQLPQSAFLDVSSAVYPVFRREQTVSVASESDEMLAKHNKGTKALHLIE